MDLLIRATFFVCELGGLLVESVREEFHGADGELEEFFCVLVGWRGGMKCTRGDVRGNDACWF